MSSTDSSEGESPSQARLALDPLDLQSLNPDQLDAVVHRGGPLLVVAGAGSGKTRVLTYRMANLILQGEATPGQILAVTFTNKAAKEMGHRIQSLLTKMGIPMHEDLWISTFHSSCARILRQDIYRLGYQPFFVIYDDSDQLSLLKRICEELNLNDKVYPPKNFRHQISQAKMLGLTYPGGPLIDKLAKDGDASRFKFTEPQIPGFDFSFSGLKTQILYFIQKESKTNPAIVEENINDICASIQGRIISILLNKLEAAAIQLGITELAIAGGVSANSGLREALQNLAEKHQWKTFIPAFEYCTDNAGMIAIAGYQKFLKGEFVGQDIAPLARYSI